MRGSTSFLLLLGALLFLAWAAAAHSELAIETVVSGLSDPVALTHAGDDRLFVVEQPGRIVIVRDGSVQSPAFLDISGLVGFGGERGLLSVAFHPNYQSNGFFFVNYTANDGDTVVARYRVSANPDRADAGSASVLLEIDQPFANHNGGQLQFGPDAMLYIGMGDGGSANDPQCRAQRNDSLLGKMLRIDVDQNVETPPYFGIPADNPFVGPGGLPDEVWATGLRNPWRFSFDRQTGDLYVGDVGQGAREEIDFEPQASAGGRNYGWKVLEGTLCLGSTSGCPGTVPGCGDPGYTAPILDYGHGGGNCAVTGGYVYRGPSAPELYGRYLYGDFCSGRIWEARRVGSNWRASELEISAPQLSSFGEDIRGDLYLLQLSGTVKKLVSEVAPDPGTISLVGAATSLLENAGPAHLTVTRSGGSDGAVSIEVTTVDQTAVAGSDYQPLSQTLNWEDREEGDRSVDIVLIDDTEVEDDESFAVVLANPTGGAILGAHSQTTVTVIDDERRTLGCQPGPTVLCLNDRRFEVTVSWQTKEGAAGAGQAVELTSDSGYFWFFSDDNVELAVKVLDACLDFDHFWFFATGLTNVETRISVRDTTSGEVREYQNPLGQAFETVLDVGAFATCG